MQTLNTMHAIKCHILSFARRTPVKIFDLFFLWCLLLVLILSPLLSVLVENDKSDECTASTQKHWSKHESFRHCPFCHFHQFYQGRICFCCRGRLSILVSKTKMLCFAVNASCFPSSGLSEMVFMTPNLMKISWLLRTDREAKWRFNGD